MKKIAFVAFVAALGLAAQGDALYWQAYGIKSSPNTTVGNQTYLAYIFADTDSGPDTAMMFANDNGKNSRVTRDTITGLLASDNYKDITTYAFRNATIPDNNGSATYSNDKGRLNSYDSEGQTGYYNAAVGWIGTGGTVDLFAVILDAATLADAKYYMFLETSSEGTINTANNSAGTSQTFHFNSQENNTWYKLGTAIPEPTSGLLLVLGMAMLALKRRRA